MAIDVFGVLPDGREVRRLVLGEEPGPVLHVLDLGATVHRLEITGGDGHRRNVVLGHASPQDYLDSSDYIGATIGRYANRIAAGRFRLDDDDVVVRTHDRGNHLHGGPDGFDRRIWDVIQHDPFRAVLALRSPDGDQGFPGNLDATVSFDVSADRVGIAFEATTDAPTVVNMTSHAYFNLDGEGAGTIDDHDLQVSADLYTPVDSTGIPIDGHESVAGTPFDFCQPVPIGSAIRDGHEQVALARGIDHNYVIKGSGWRSAATLTSRRTDTSLQLFTDQPGLQVYSGNFLDGARSSTTDRLYRQSDGIALEPQVYPDSPNRPDYPSPVLRPGQTYRAAMEWRFTAHEPPPGP
jgi:aldose 1-epimerase